MKKFLCIVITAVMLLSLIACGNGDVQPTDPQLQSQATEPTEPQQPGEEGKILKVLTLGHSLAVDCGHMLAWIAAAEGFESLTVGTLYYSGCSLNQHVTHLTMNSPAYDLYISSTDMSYATPTITNGVTMEYALASDYWDIIVMQGGVFEIASDAAYKNGNIKTIQKYIQEKCLNPNIKLAWHMPWAPPVNNDLRDQYPYSSNNIYYTSYARYGDNRTALYKDIAKCVENNIITDELFWFVIPTGTAMENALSSYLEETDLHRDYVHASDFARVMCSYVWYCKLAGIEELSELKMNVVPGSFKVNKSFAEWVLTDAEKTLIIESVNNALKTPFAVTQSQYTTAP